MFPSTHAELSARLTVSLRMSDDEFEINFATFKLFFLDAENFALWTIPFALAVILRLITSKWTHQLILPMCTLCCVPEDTQLKIGSLDFLVIPVIFYIVVAAAQLNLADLRESRWIFDVGADPSQRATHWYSFYSFLGLLRFLALLLSD